MTSHRTGSQRRRRGFTLVELLVVMGIILLLISISAAVLSSALGSARQRATQATILKIHGLMQQRVEAFNRALDRTNLQPAITKMQRDLGLGNTANPKIYEILVRKQIFQQRFPQSFFERNLSTLYPSIFVSSAHNQNTESAALLYWILTKSEVYGVAPVDQSEFSSSEVRDTDGDGLLEFVDGWGHPLRFYRWPTNLFRAGTSTVAPGVSGTSPITLSPIDPQRTFASVLWSGLPAPPSSAGGLDPLARDPDDPTGELRRFIFNSSSTVATGFLTMLQNRFHTPDTYHAFLIVSPGPDNVLGLAEPFDFSGTPGLPAPDTTTLISTSPALAAPLGQGRLASLLSYNPVQTNPINDNLTNRKR